MTSKELSEILNKTRRTPNISLTPKQVKEIANKLEVLDAIKKEFYNTFYNWYLLDNMSSLRLDNEPKEYEIIRQWIKEWLNNDSSYL